ncbi:hypothetical protein PCANC_01829 [Puccinia coronata f. sp. avenae]|uniref:Reverse transcriptase Ty1/copia-type domain-containing protein n=1 Tax=Puccinia coronata f. sp. avenae TaxID=200324 RepID=A0A2N5W555_9BASI|nr:hypothetical protein PCANC_01829 [Puccinia coronata f. sp. avenae]
MDVEIHANHIALSQEKLIDKGLELLGLTDCKPVATPLSVGVQLLKASKDDEAKFKKLNLNYRTFTGILNYLACRTRPDLAPAVSILSAFNNNPGINHWNQIIHFWKYVKGSRHLHLTLRPNDPQGTQSIQHFTDATWADDLETRLSRSGSICFWKSCPVAWSSKKQRNITLSSTEAEMNALADGVQENQWVKFLVEELWNKTLEPSTFHVNNQGLVKKIKNFSSNSKTKHLDIKMKWLRNLKNKNEISVVLIPSKDMIANTLIKSSNAESLNRLKEKYFLVQYSSKLLQPLASATWQSLVVALFRYLDHSQSRLLNSLAIQGCSPIKYHSAPSSSITPLTPLHHQPSLRSTIIHPQDSLVKSQLGEN